MKLRSVIFDFNGTLYWDTHLHNQAWDTFLERHGISLSDQEKNIKIHGKNNQDILAGLFPDPITMNQVNGFIKEKEGIYQDLCLQSDLKLAPGATDFLGFLTLEGIPFTIATSAGIENVDFYFKYLDLSRYFDFSKVIYNDGSFPGKPHPHIFLEATRNLDVPVQQTLVFEDSSAGILSAERAGAGEIIIVDSNREDFHDWDYQVIRDFNEVDISLFLAG